VLVSLFIAVTKSLRQTTYRRKDLFLPRVSEGPSMAAGSTVSGPVVRQGVMVEQS
jgi:hypothetical protein